MQMREVTYLSILVRILCALFLGGVIGMERGMKNRPAGLRTYMLVCVGSCLIMLTNQYIYQFYDTGDPVRMGAQVVSGIGFLGAGTIIITRRQQIKGLTTAAGLWAAAAVGLALGIGFYEGALVGGGAIFMTLATLQVLDSRMHRNSRMAEIYVELSAQITLGEFLAAVRQQEAELNNIQIDRDDYLGDGVRSFTATLKRRHSGRHAEILNALRRADGVICIEEL